MIDLDLKIEDADVISSLKQFAVKSGVPVNFVVNDQMRLWLQDLIKQGAPQKSGNTGKNVSRPAGRKAIAQDLDKIFVGATRIGNFKAINYLGEMFRGYESPLGAFYLVPQAYWEPGMSDGGMKPLHESWRNKRSGRVNRKKRNAVSKQGFYTVVKKTHVKRTELSRYRKERQKAVGKMAASWMPALTNVSRKVRIKSPKVPQWLKDVSGASGTFSTTMNVLGSGYVEATNNMRYAERKLKSLIPTTRLKRQKDIRDNLRRRMRTIQKQFNSRRLRKAA